MDNHKLKCLIIDDDPTITDLIQHYCEKTDSIEFCIACNNAIDGLKLLSNEHFDLLFLDFNMPEMNGRALMELKQDASKVIIVSSHPDFAVESYQYPSIVDYLLKPVSYDKFLACLTKITQKVEKHEMPKDHFFVKDGKKWIPVKVKEVLFIKSDSNYIVLHTLSGNIMSLMNMKDLESTLANNFTRVHRSYIINKDFIDFITTEEVSIKGHSIPISAKYKQSIKDIIG